MKTLLSRAALAAAAMTFCLSDAHATTATATMTVSLTVTSSCSVSASALNFGTSTVSSNVDATTTVSVTCGAGTNYAVTLGDGQHSLGVGLRQLQTSSASGALEYSLYTDSGRTIPWSGATSVSGTSSGSAQSITVYGRVPASMSPSPGSYSDCVQVIVTY